MLQIIFGIITNKNCNLTIRKTAATNLKNFISDYFYDNTEKAIKNSGLILTKETKVFFMENALKLLLNSEEALINVIVEMIYKPVKGANGYMIIWPKLMAQVAEGLKPHQIKTSIFLYKLIAKLTKRYHIEPKSQPLFSEIIETMSYICEPMTLDATSYTNYLMNKTPLTSADKIYLEILYYILKIFYNLNYQDFPEFFEDHLKEWLSVLNNLLVLPGNNANYSLATDDVSKEWVLKLKAKTMKCINFYFQQYYDDIKDYTNPFYNSIWLVMQSILSNQFSFGKLAKELLYFYSHTIRFNRIDNKSIINEQTAEHIIYKLVIPNMQLTQEELDHLEDNQNEFLKQEFEEADITSNRYYASELLKELIKSFPGLINGKIFPYIGNCLNNYYVNKVNNWKEKVVVINLLFATLIENFAQQIGVTKMHENIPMKFDDIIAEIFNKEFQDSNGPDICKIFSFKFLATFRLQLSNLGDIFNAVSNIIKSSSQVVQAAALLSLDLIINMKNIETRKFISLPFVNNEGIFANLVGIFTAFISNDINSSFAMKCFYRTLRLCESARLENQADNLGKCMDEFLKKILDIYNKNKSSNDEFNYYFFETCVLILKKMSQNPQNNNQSNNVVYIKTFYNNLTNDIQTSLNGSYLDLMGYSLQLHAMYLFNIKEVGQFDLTLMKNLIENKQIWQPDYKHIFSPSLEFIKVCVLISNNREYINKIFFILFELIKLKMRENCV